MVTDSEDADFSNEIREKVPLDLQRHLNEPDGAAILTQKLPQVFTPEQIADPTVEQRAWELIGLFYFNQPKRRSFEALSIFLALYQHMLDAQERSRERVHKGMPLLWAAESYASNGYAAHRKRYLMLALCEDAITGNGTVAPESTGVYFRLVWRLGMGDAVLRRYAAEANTLATQHPAEGSYPEWVLQNLDQEWLTELASPAEANVYIANTQYVKDLLNRLGSTGHGVGAIGRVHNAVHAWLQNLQTGKKSVHRL